jgi:hypothetical protein
LEQRQRRCLSASVPNRLTGLEDPLAQDQESVEVSLSVGSQVAGNVPLRAAHRAVNRVSFSPQKCSTHLDHAVLLLAHAQAEQRAEQNVERLAEDGDASEL